ncbi:xanthine dehydrogenase [Neobacillus notoginsengisoli]|uniref:Xanthine dehydrogenase n=1 Tax=Neobacillus notoginsengisoli TaxID=1578198 RepID=A0A417YSM9_9BACI|nr:nucleotidyltransferase family protein [Neobacillus notoginsengisoli]RHW38956.1 xanthine dehydrogenase [Neobacillus notoginsengisoli]
MKIFGIYLAAGKSRRMGADKRKLPLGGVPLGSIALNQALISKLDHIFIVTALGDKLDWLQASFFLYPAKERWSLLECPDAEQGLGSSLKYGVKHAAVSGADAAMVLLADQPFVRSEVINKLIDCYQSAPSLFIGAEGDEGFAKPPILFSSECFRYVEKLGEDQGLRAFVRKEFRTRGKTIDFRVPLLFCDIDTKEDYHSLMEKFR